MKLIGLHADGFGKLHDFKCGLDAPVTVIYGPNEAGKSTILAFIRSMLYGFATRANPAERLEPAAGGRHGGRLYFRDDDGDAYMLERYASAPGKVAVRPLEDEAAADAGALSRKEAMTQLAWERQFLGGIGERMFRQLFAITLTELQAVGMLEGDELGKQLYHAGWSGGAAVARTEKLLALRLDGLYRPRGSNQQINRLMKALEQTEAELRRLDDGIQMFNELTETLNKAEKQLRMESDKLPSIRERADLLARACELRPHWVDKLSLMKELEKIGHPPRLPAEARSRYEALSAEHERLLSELDRSRLAIARSEREIGTLPESSTLAERADEIEKLLLSAETARASRFERTELEAELREHREALDRLLARIAPDWTEAQLKELRISVADRETVRAVRASMGEAEKERRRAETELQALDEQYGELSAQLVEPARPAWDEADAARNGRRSSADLYGRAHTGFSAGSGLPELLPLSAEALRYAARAFEDAWRELELERLRAEHEAAGSAAARAAEGGRFGGGADWAAAGLLAAAAIAFAAAGWSAAAAAAGAGAAGLAAAALLRGRAAAPRGRAPRGQAGEAAEAHAAAAASRLAAAERRVAAALRALVSEPESLLAALLAQGPAAAGSGASRTIRSSRAGREQDGSAPGSRRNRGLLAADDPDRVGAKGSSDAAGSYDADLLSYRREAAAASEESAGYRRGANDDIAPGGPGNADAIRVRLRSAVDARLEELRAGEHEAERRGDLELRLRRLRAQRDSLQAAANLAAEQTRLIEERWRVWLGERRLPPDLSPDAALETFELAEQAMLRLQTRDRAAAKAAALDARIDAFDRDAQRLCADFPDFVRAASVDHAVQLKLLKAEADKQREAVRRSAELFQSIEEQQAVQAELETALSRVKDRRDKWFEAAGAASEAQWLEALAASERLQAIEAEMYRLDALLTAGFASGQYGQLEVWYEEADENRLVEMKLEAESELLETERRLQELHEQNGRLRQKLDQLLRENERQRLAMQLQQQQSDLEAMIGRYAVASIGLTLINRTKRIMEEQRQPAVLREASRFMAIMSEGKYKRIVLPEGARSIRLITGEDREVDSIFLSRGTAEQLYLSMRFALADEASAGLPMILDDLFVNFDRSRLEAAADVLRELAERRQIVLLTCHEHVRSLLLDKLPAAQSVAFT